MAELAQFPVTTAAPLTSADWTAKNPLLDPWQMGAESDTGNIKFNANHAATAWNSLSYVTAGLFPTPTPEAYVADPSGAVADTDTEARTAIIAIRDALIALGLMEDAPE